MQRTDTRHLDRRFDTAAKSLAYASEHAYIRDLMALVALHLVGAAAIKADCAEDTLTQTDAANLSGTRMSFEEAASYLAGFPQPPPEPQEALLSLLHDARAHIASRVVATESAGVTLHIERLRVRLNLSDFAFFCMICALSAVLDRGFESLFVSLHGDTELPFATIGAVQACYSIAYGDAADLWQSVLSPASPESRLLFCALPEERPPLLCPLRLRADALAYILHQPYRSRTLAACSNIIPDEKQTNDTPLFLEHQLQAADCALTDMQRDDSARLCILCGAAGSGKRLTLAALAARRDCRFLLVRLDELTGEEPLDEIVFAALFEGCIPCFYLTDAAHSTALRRVMASLRRYGLGAFLLTERLRSNIVIDGCLVTRVDYPAPDLKQSLHFWWLFSRAYAMADTVQLEQLAAKYQLTAGQIKSALCTANTLAQAEIGTAHIDGAILLGNTGRLSEIADKIEVFYTWDDLVLGDAPKQMLRDACDRIKYRWLVETQWGFGGKSAYGNGVSILLYGPPGTGKTMSAQVMAGELGLPLYRINLAQIISKYIGETAKNLDAVFTEAKSSNVILFFDEADALFSKRTEVKTSNDRHANSESSYLLQKIEEYAGVSILATNLANNFDEAFRRRIGYMINLHMPSPEQRLALWRGSLPPSAPIAPELDLRMLADNLEFSGSVIKSAALQAAYFAAADGTSIGMAHIARAVRRELQKLGKSEPHFLTMYPE